MKKITIIILVSVLVASSAQSQVTLGARAGYNLTNVYQKYENRSIKGLLEWKSGFQLGVLVDCALLDDLSVQPGIIFSQQGMKGYTELDGVKTKLTFNMNYIQIPVNIQYKSDSGNFIKLFQAGPYLGYGIGGKMKGENTIEGKPENFSEKIKFGTDNDADLKAFDFGLGVGAGLEIGHFQAGLGYNFGLVCLTQNAKSKNLGMVFTITYLFK